MIHFGGCNPHSLLAMNVACGLEWGSFLPSALPLDIMSAHWLPCFEKPWTYILQIKKLDRSKKNHLTLKSGREEK